MVALVAERPMRKRKQANEDGQRNEGQSMSGDFAFKHDCLRDHEGTATLSALLLLLLLLRRRSLLGDFSSKDASEQHGHSILGPLQL